MVEQKSREGKPGLRGKPEDAYDLSYLKTKIPLTSKRNIEKINKLVDALSSEPEIKLDVVKSLAIEGIPSDHRGLRAIVWKLMLKSFPTNRREWREFMRKRREIYESYCKDFLETKAAELSLLPEEFLRRKRTYYDDQMNPDAKRKKPVATPLGEGTLKFFRDLDLWDEIEKDTKRTRAEMNFFVTPVSRSCSCSSSSFPDSFKRVNRIGKVEEGQFSVEEELHCDVLTRILFIYAKLNPSLAYVQGMNEILAILYYCFANDINEEFKREAEVDTFFCFTMLMGEIKDGFEQTFDATNFGIYGKIVEMNSLLKDIDFDLWNHLDSRGVKPEYYSLRWILLMFTQELEIGDVLSLWDSIFAMDNKNLFLTYICVAVLEVNRERLLKMEFSDLMEKLQKLEISDVSEVLLTAFNLYQNVSGKASKSFNI